MSVHSLTKNQLILILCMDMTNSADLSFRFYLFKLVAICLYFAIIPSKMHFESTVDQIRRQFWG